MYFAYAQQNFIFFKMATPVLNIIIGLIDFFQDILMNQLVL